MFTPSFGCTKYRDELVSDPILDFFINSSKQSTKSLQIKKKYLFFSTTKRITSISLALNSNVLNFNRKIIMFLKWKIMAQWWKKEWLKMNKKKLNWKVGERERKRTFVKHFVNSVTIMCDKGSCHWEEYNVIFKHK